MSRFWEIATSSVRAIYQELPYSDVDWVIQQKVQKVHLEPKKKGTDSESKELNLNERSELLAWKPGGLVRRRTTSVCHLQSYSCSPTSLFLPLVSCLLPAPFLPLSPSLHGGQSDDVEESPGLIEGHLSLSLELLVPLILSPCAFYNYLDFIPCFFAILYFWVSSLFCIHAVYAL